MPKGALNRNREINSPILTRHCKTLRKHNPHFSVDMPIVFSPDEAAEEEASRSVRLNESALNQEIDTEVTFELLAGATAMLYQERDEALAAKNEELANDKAAVIEKLMRARSSAYNGDFGPAQTALAGLDKF